MSAQSTREAAARTLRQAGLRPSLVHASQVLAPPEFLAQLSGADSDSSGKNDDTVEGAEGEAAFGGAATLEAILFMAAVSIVGAGVLKAVTETSSSGSDSGGDTGGEDGEDGEDGDGGEDGEGGDDGAEGGDGQDSGGGGETGG